MHTEIAPAPARHAAHPAPGARTPDTISLSPATARHNRDKGAGWLTYHPAGLRPGIAVFLTAAERAEIAAWAADITRTDTIELGR